MACVTLDLSKHCVAWKQTLASKHLGCVGAGCSLSDVDTATKIMKTTTSTPAMLLLAISKGAL